MAVEIVFTYDQKDHSYIVTENGSKYTMPQIYALMLKKFLSNQDASLRNPVQIWYNALRDIERCIVEKEPVFENFEFAPSKNVEASF